MEAKTRRRFLKTVAAGGAAAGFGLPRVAAKDAALGNGVVKLRPEIEPLVRLLEDTPRDRVIEEVAQRIRDGLSYREVLAALLLAGVRNVQPRPSVGFKFHAVLVVFSAHQASLSGPDKDRWLPLLWAIDDFKRSQARDVEEGDWTMAPVDESRVPSAEKATRAFGEAMERWDVGAADAAVAGLSRTAGASEIFDLFVPFATRDLRSIGHKAIFLTNAWRTLQVMGWEHAEPVLRSLAYALLNHRGDPNPAGADLETDRPWRRSAGLAGQFRAGWQDGRLDDGATRALLGTFRGGSAEDASGHVLEVINAGVGPQSVTDALFTGASELMLRQPRIPALHAVTTTNAMHYLYQGCGDENTRRRLLLQSAAFLPMFRGIMGGRGAIADLRLDAIAGAGSPAASIDEVLAAGTGADAARAVLGFATDTARAQELIDAVRRRIFAGARDAHHYKFSSAVLEDYFHVSPAWRGRLLACGAQYLPDGTSPLVGRVRQALG